MLVASLLCILCYVTWWTRLYRRAIPRSNHAPLDVRYRFHALAPRLVLWARYGRGWAETGRNFALTLPHPWRAQAIVLIAQGWITAAHRAHEVAGHTPQIAAMGPVDYLATYLWHQLLRRGVWADHMMEQDAEARGRRLRNMFRDLGKVPK